jgi:hypothetical protein
MATPEVDHLTITMLQPGRHCRHDLEVHKGMVVAIRKFAV